MNDGFQLVFALLFPFPRSFSVWGRGPFCAGKNGGAGGILIVLLIRSWERLQIDGPPINERLCFDRRVAHSIYKNALSRKANTKRRRVLIKSLPAKNLIKSAGDVFLLEGRRPDPVVIFN